MRLCVLGWPAVVGEGGQVTEIRGPRQVALLALLAAARGDSVRAEQIEDELWGRPVADSTVRVNVTRLRGWLAEHLGRDPVVATPLGYRIDLAEDEVNALAFERAAAAASTARSRGRYAEAARTAEAADRLWRGRAFEGALDVPSVQGERTRLEALRVDTWQERAISLIELGDLGRALDQIEAMQKVQPYRETAYGLQLIALHRCDRRPEAVRRYHETVTLFHEELGVGPGAALVGLADELLADRPPAPVGEAYLRAVAPAVGEDAPGDAPAGEEAVRQLPPILASTLRQPMVALPFVGRQETVDRLQAALSEPGSVAVVEGAGGMGKTRLATAVAQRALAAGVDVLYAACTRSEGVGSAPVPDLLAAAMERLPAEVAAEVRPAVAGLVPAVAAPGAAVAAGGQGGADIEVDGETRRLQLVGVVEQVMARATSAPTLVVVDDLQWMGPAGERFLLHLVERLPSPRWLFLTRPGDRTEAAVAFLGAIGRRPAEWVDLTPLEAEDVRTMVAEVARTDQVDRWFELLMNRAGGLPFATQALLRHLASGGDPAQLPRGIAHVVQADVARLGPDAQALAELLAVAGGPERPAVLAEAAGLTPSRLEAASDALVAAGLAGPTGAPGGGSARPPVEDGTSGPALVLAHDLIGDALLDWMGADRTAAHHRALGRALSASGDVPVMALDHLLAAGDQVAVAELDAVAGPALHRLILQTAFERAQALGEAYLARAGEVAESVRGLEARVQVATALLAMGETSRGLAVHEDLLPQVRASQDARLLTDLVLARGPVDTGGADPLERVREARVLIELLPCSERTRRIQLACWAAHNLLVVGASEEARPLLATARALLDEPADPDVPPVGPVVRGIVAGVSYQATTAVEVAPADGARAYRALVDLEAETGLTSVAATRRLFAVDQAVRFGGLPELRAAVDEMGDHLSEFPRPDLRWWVVAAEAAIAQAAGDLATADAELVRAASVGAQLSVAPAGPVALLQRLMVQWELGTLRAMHPALGRAIRPDAPPVEVAMAALVCTEADDLEGAAAAGRRLLEIPRFLSAAGPSWPAVATIAARVALVADQPELAERLAVDLTPHVGTGLSVNGLAHFGPCDRLLGLLAAARGDLDAAVDLVEGAWEDSRAKGLTLWAAKAADDAADLRERRGRAGDGAEVARFRREAAETRASFRLPGSA